MGRLRFVPLAKKVGSATVPTDIGGHGGPPYYSYKYKKKISNIEY